LFYCFVVLKAPSTASGPLSLKEQAYGSLPKRGAEKLLLLGEGFLKGRRGRRPLRCRRFSFSVDLRFPCGALLRPAHDCGRVLLPPQAVPLPQRGRYYILSRFAFCTLRFALFIIPSQIFIKPLDTRIHIVIKLSKIDRGASYHQYLPHKSLPKAWQ